MKGIPGWKIGVGEVPEAHEGRKNRRNYVLHTSHPALMSPNKRKRLYRGRDVLSKHHS